MPLPTKVYRGRNTTGFVQLPAVWKYREMQKHLTRQIWFLCPSKSRTPRSDPFAFSIFYRLPRPILNSMRSIPSFTVHWRTVSNKLRRETH